MACGEVLIHVSDTSFGHIHLIKDVPYTKIAEHAKNKDSKEWPNICFIYIKTCF